MFSQALDPPAFRATHRSWPQPTRRHRSSSFATKAVHPWANDGTASIPTTRARSVSMIRSTSTSSAPTTPTLRGICQQRCESAPSEGGQLRVTLPVYITVVVSAAAVTDSVSGGTYRSESVCQYVFEFVCSVEFLPCGQEFSDVRDSRNACVAFGLLGFEVRMVGLEIATLWCANSSQPSSLTL